MLRLFAKFSLLVFAIFIAPALIHFAVWSLQDRPSSWRYADWSSAGILPAAAEDKPAKVYVLSARTGGIKGAFATHSWLVLKPENANRYDRYDVVGWGRPVRHNGYDADGRWYSNVPVIETSIEGEQAARLIPQIKQAIAHYRWQNYGDYTIWPGPNSNTFVASIIRAVDGFDASTPSTAVGRDYPDNGNWVEFDPSGTLRLSAGGYAGLVVGLEDGLELNFLGLVAGINPAKLEIKVPGFGSFKL
ncbi:MAG: DUF3750 domain-containing protein [Rhizobiaceae bacterium]